MEKTAEMQKLQLVYKKEERDLEILQLKLEQHKIDLERTRLEMEVEERNEKADSDEKGKKLVRKLLRRNCR